MCEEFYDTLTYGKLNTAVILLGTLGGVYAFGIMGLYFDSSVLGALRTALRGGSDNRFQIVKIHTD